MLKHGRLVGNSNKKKISFFPPKVRPIGNRIYETWSSHDGNCCRWEFCRSGQWSLLIHLEEGQSRKTKWNKIPKKKVQFNTNLEYDFGVILLVQHSWHFLLIPKHKSFQQTANFLFNRYLHIQHFLVSLVSCFPTSFSLFPATRCVHIWPMLFYSRAWGFKISSCFFLGRVGKTIVFLQSINCFDQCNVEGNLFIVGM